jgi:hypothetical protein
MATATGSSLTLKTAAFNFSVRALGWLVPMMLTAVATAWVTYHYTRKANTEMVVQQQKLTNLQQFRASGAQLQQALSRMSDAIVDGGSLDPARREMRDAIARNLSDAVAVRSQLGPEATDAYVRRLAALRIVVDQTDADSGAALWQGSLDVMEQQKRLLQNAETRVQTGG